MSDEHVPSHDPLRDPLGLDAVDREIRINELNERTKGMGISPFEVSDECPSEEHEKFLQGMAQFESGPLSSHFSELVNMGVELPEPASLDDAALRAKLWEVINALAKYDTFVYHTNHLSDRQLYEHLWSDTLREETTIMPRGSGWRCHLDMIGGCSEEDIQIGLRYYDTEEDRRRWAKDFPKDVIPPHEDPPYDRDRHLPIPASELPEAEEWDDELDDELDEE